MPTVSPRDATPSHGTADVGPGVSLHYVEAGQGERTAVLLHGFPQTSHQWRKVMPALVDAGMRVVAPDYRGAGWSSKPPSGYDKRSMAEDVRSLVRDTLGVTAPVVLVGHDIGGMIAVAFALRFRAEVSHLVAIDTLLPGTAVFDRMRGDPRGWHAAFHSARDIAELLVQGRERAYLRHMVDVRLFDPSAIAPEDFDVYVRAYEAPGAMRAAFELYRAFEEDARALREALAQGGKLTTPTLAVGGERSGLGTTMREMLEEVAARVDAVTVPRSGHWVPEENAAFLTDAIVRAVAREPNVTRP